VPEVIVNIVRQPILLVMVITAILGLIVAGVVAVNELRKR